MSKAQPKFICQQCGYESSKWFGKCPSCGGWNTAVETLAPERKTKGAAGSKSREVKPVLLDLVPKSGTSRILTKIPELDRVLGGGLVPGQVILIAGEPGIGKSTLLLQVADRVAGTKRQSQLREAEDKKAIFLSSVSEVLYTSGEESVNQIKIRADRLGIENKNIKLLEETDIDTIIEASEEELPKEGDSNFVQESDSSRRSAIPILIVDSIQTMTTSELSGTAGSVGQVRECAYRLVRFAKEHNVPVFIVGHVTKEGTVAGPSVLMHIVDTVLWFEGDKSLTFRLLRAVKNRFGPTDEVGVFEMQDKGLVSLDNPEKMFVGKHKENVPGNVVTCILEGTRPILIEIQALVVPTKMPFPKRVAQGIDSKRFEILLAILQRRCGLPLYEFDCFVNLAGGISIKNDPSADLAICLALASAFLDKALDSKVFAIGEVGLLGEIRDVIAQEKRVKEAKRLGYSLEASSKTFSYLNQAIKKLLEGKL